jgi:SAM-dependent methyltransferase
MMQKGYDRVNHRLVFYGATPGPSFWDAHWMKQNLPAFPKNARQSFVVRATRKYLPTGARVLEGGCGRGDNVYALQSIGYDAYGVDFAPATVAAIRDAMPELKISLGDVRHLEFPPGHFDGYWSLGVIEHFEEGYSSSSPAGMSSPPYPPCVP